MSLMQRITEFLADQGLGPNHPRSTEELPPWIVPKEQTRNVQLAPPPKLGLLTSFLDPPEDVSSSAVIARKDAVSVSQLCNADTGGSSGFFRHIQNEFGARQLVLSPSVPNGFH